MATPINVLLVENNPDDAELVKDVLQQGGLDVRIERVESEQEMRAALLKGGWDMILLDYVLPGFSGHRALKLCHLMGCQAPIIIVSGSVGEDTAVEMMKQGADDYVLKGNLTRLPAAVRRAITDAHVRAERRRSQEELRESREWLYATLCSVGEGVIATDAAGRIRFMNPIAETLTSCAEPAAIGRGLDGILRLADPQGNPLPPGSLTGMLSDLSVSRNEELLLLRDGKEALPVIMTASRIVNDQQAVIGAVLALRDIAERKRAEEKVQESNRELQQFVHSVSHDLQEPLRMIRLYSEMIERKLVNADADIQEYLRFVGQGAKRMYGLLAGLRTYAEITRSDAPQPDPADAEVVLHNVLVNLSAAIDGSGAVVVYDRLPTVPVHHAHLAQLFQNLISNSIKYRREDQPPTIRVETRRHVDKWQFSFSDNGSGIPAEYISRVFDFFQRFHSADISGTGMGLAICQRIVQRYGGRIWLESTPGEGSTFHFTLPALPSGHEAR